MRVEAIKLNDGFFIPILEDLKDYKEDKLLLEIKIVKQISSKKQSKLPKKKN